MRHKRQGLALVGLRGTGKSTVGRILAERLGWPFADADHEIEARSGTSIRAIFEEQGEGAFRDWEETILADLTGRPGTIVATGGGAVLRETNRARLGSFGFIVWLVAAPSELADRLRSDSRGLAGRPALTSAGTIDELAQVLEARTPLYEEVADLVVETAGKTPEEVATAILESWSTPAESSVP
ncbi:shikimate kinase [Singulisphaera sp. PoT]|uniref:shikimate kinase n=1 Tax=Singulisphaera sp. PoT TaxID=3411797 RepID=UPI003BF4CF11